MNVWLTTGDRKSAKRQAMHVEEKTPRRQYVVICAGRDGKMKSKMGDVVVAFDVLPGRKNLKC